MALTLPQFVVIKSYYHTDDGNAYYKDDGSVVLGEKSVFSTTVKIEVEVSQDSESHVNLRFCYSNKFWQKSDASNFIVAQSNQPDEDTSKPSCTLFEAVKVNDDGVFYLRHVQSGGRLLIDDATLGFYLNENPNPEDGYLTFVNWESLVKLPTTNPVAFKGGNGLYLRPYNYRGFVFLQFASSDPNDGLSGHRVVLMDDGRIALQSESTNMYWNLSFDLVDIFTNMNTTAILAGTSEVDTSNGMFRPVKVDDYTIVLRSEANSMFCKRFTGVVENILVPTDSRITDESRLQVEELVMKRRISRVVYKMDSSRILNQRPFLAGSTQVTNEGDEEASMEVDITYQNEVSYSFSNSMSLNLGVSMTIEAGLLGIEETSITMTAEIDTSMEWNTTTTTTTSVTATTTVSVPPKSWVTVSYVGTQGTCNVPFEYVQEDTSAKDGSTTETTLSDGIYTGVNCYNFNFDISEPQPIAD